MKAILFLVGGLLAVLAFIFYVKHYLITPENMFFFTVEVKGKGRDEVVRELVNRLNEKGLGVTEVVPGEKEGVPNYTTLIACDIPEKEEILLSAPFLSVLFPCSVVVYEKEGRVYITSPKEILMLRDYSGELGERNVQRIVDAYQKLRIAVAEVAKGEKR